MDKWLPNSPLLRNLIQGPLYPCQEGTNINSIWHNKSWHPDTLAITIPNQFTQTIFNTFRYNTIINSDKLTWGIYGNGIFTITSAYSLVDQSHNTNLNAGQNTFNQIWKIHCLPKIKYFLWLAQHNKLLKKFTLSSMGLNITPNFPICNHLSEDILNFFSNTPSLKIFVTTQQEKMQPQGSLSRASTPKTGPSHGER